MPVGRTQDAGWQIGVSRTDHPLERVWDALVTSPDLWLGPAAELPTELGQAWTASDGSGGELRGRRERERIRLTMHRGTGHGVPPDKPGHETTVQVTVVATGSRTRVRFHEERMLEPMSASPRGGTGRRRSTGSRARSTVDPGY